MRPRPGAVAAMRSQLAGLLAHEHAPLALAQQASGLPAQVPLFTALLNYRHSQPGGSSRPARGRWASRWSLPGSAPTTRWLVAVDDTGTGFVIRTDAVAPGDPRACCAMLRTALGSLVTALEDAPVTPLRAMPVLGEQEREQVVREWNETSRAVPDGSVAQWAGEQAAASPDAVAVVCGDAWLTYGELWGRASRLAGWLRGAGVGAESVVGLCLERGPELVAGVLGVWLAGGAYLPLDPGYPVGRLGLMLADSGAVVVAGTGAVLGDLPAGRVRLVELDDPSVAAAIRGMPAVPPAGQVRADQLAYVIYTSGSTGAPKGVGVTHGSVANYVASVPGQVGLGEPGGRYLLLQGLATDLGNTVVFGALASGGTLHVLDAAGVMEPATVARYLAALAIDYLKVVPSHLAALAAGCGVAAVVPGRSLVLGGEAAATAWVRELVEVAGERGVFNHYGPTEATIGAVTARLSLSLLGSDEVPIGSPVANARAYVLDRWLSRSAGGGR